MLSFKADKLCNIGSDIHIYVGNMYKCKGVHYNDLVGQRNYSKFLNILALVDKVSSMPSIHSL